MLPGIAFFHVFKVLCNRLIFLKEEKSSLWLPQLGGSGYHYSALVPGVLRLGAVCGGRMLALSGQISAYSYWDTPHTLVGNSICILTPRTLSLSPLPSRSLLSAKRAIERGARNQTIFYGCMGLSMSVNV